MGSHMMVSLDIKQLMYYRRPKNPRLFSILGGEISYMALFSRDQPRFLLD